MLPLSCENCCHNPLQLGPIGLAFGFCVVHRMILSASHATTCGQLLRKDLPAVSARGERQIHARSHAVDHVVLLSNPAVSAESLLLAESPGAVLPADSVVGVVRRADATSGNSIAKLQRLPGARAEIALLSLAKARIQDAMEASMHSGSEDALLRWMLSQLAREPELAANDLHEPLTAPLAATVSLGKWHIVALRLGVLSDIGEWAKATGGSTDAIVALVDEAFDGTDGGDGEQLFGWVLRNQNRFLSLSPARDELAFRIEARRNRSLPHYRSPETKARAA